MIVSNVWLDKSSEPKESSVTAAVSPASFSWKVPSVFLGARLYPVLDKSAAEIVALAKNIEDHQDLLGDCCWLGLAHCQKRFNISPSFGGSEPCLAGANAPHAHFVHWGDSGTAILQAPISSQPFFDYALTQLPKLGRGFGFPEESVPVFAELLAEERSKLLPAIAEHEQPFLEGDKFVTFVTERLVWIG